MLGRTYYATTEFILPAAVMQPLWESVKRPDGGVNFGLSYHRTMYDNDGHGHHGQPLY